MSQKCSLIYFASKVKIDWNYKPSWKMAPTNQVFKLKPTFKTNKYFQ